MERLEALGQHGPQLLEVVADGEVVTRAAFRGAYRATLEGTLKWLERSPDPPRTWELWAVWQDGRRELLKKKAPAPVGAGEPTRWGGLPVAGLRSGTASPLFSPPQAGGRGPPLAEPSPCQGEEPSHRTGAPRGCQGFNVY